MDNCGPNCTPTIYLSYLRTCTFHKRHAANPLFGWTCWAPSFAGVVHRAVAIVAASLGSEGWPLMQGPRPLTCPQSAMIAAFNMSDVTLTHSVTKTFLKVAAAGSLRRSMRPASSSERGAHRLA